MKFDIITPFPELIKTFAETSLMGRSSENELLDIKVHDPRNFAEGNRKNIDDYPYGGGCGMVMTAEPLKRCIENIFFGPDSDEVPEDNVRIVLTSPQGRKFNQKIASEFAESDRIIIICGHYEGVDERVADTLCTDEISIGDFVMTGGEIAAMAVIDSVSRHIPGVVGKTDSVAEDSFFEKDHFDHPHFTRPPEYQDYHVPEVILSGHHANIDTARKQWALSKTARIRPDLVNWEEVRDVFEDPKKKKARIKRLKRLKLGPYSPEKRQDAREKKTSKDKSVPEKELQKAPESRNLYLGLVHCPVLNKFNGVSTTSVTNFDIHDISRSARTFGVKNYFLVLPQKNQRDLVEKIRDFWLDPSQKIPHKKRLSALDRIKVSPNLNSVCAVMERDSKQKPIIAVTSAKDTAGIEKIAYTGLVEVSKKTTRPLLILFGTGYGLAPEIMDQADFLLPPITGYDEWNHLSVRAAAAIVLSNLNDAYDFYDAS